MTAGAPGKASDIGRLAENIVYFARALRAAGIPVGPGSVLDALAAVKAAGVGTREDFYWTLHAVFVKRHEHSLLFDQAFRIFFRRAATRQAAGEMLPQAPMPENDKPQARRAARPGGAVRRASARTSRSRGGRDRRAAHRVRSRGAAEEGLRADVGGRDRRRQGRDQAARALARRGEDAAALRRNRHGHLIDCAARCAPA